MDEKDQKIQELEARVAELEREASIDTLTGLQSRSAGMKILGRQVRGALQTGRRDPTRSIALLAIDLVGFKKVNDQKGHAAGDLVLSLVGQAIIDTLRATDVGWRMGGDEFVALLWNIDVLGDAMVIAERLRKAIYRAGTKIAVYGVDARIGGVLWVPSVHGSVSPEALYEAADQQERALRLTHAKEKVRIVPFRG